ncbi:MAG: hypothetical protein R6X08_00660 [Desulfosalsimonadaceae bacterium]
MQKKDYWVRASLVLVLALGLMVCGCQSTSSGKIDSSGKITPVRVENVTVERLNEISPEKFQKSDVLVFRTIFNFKNPGNELAVLKNFNFEVKVDDGTADKTIIQSASMPKTFIPGGETFTWYASCPLSYGGMIGSYVTRGVGGGGIKDAVGKLNEVWKALGNDEKTFYISGRYSTAYPNAPEAGKKIRQFDFEYTVPEL